MLHVLITPETYALIPRMSLLDGTRFTVRALDPPYWTPLYFSMLEQVSALGEVHKNRNEAYYAAMHPIKLQAGQAPMPNGELGRPAAADPVNTPELLGGRVLHTNV